MKKKNIIIASAAFVVTCAIGFGITKLIKPSISEEQDADVSSSSLVVEATEGESSMVDSVSNSNQQLGDNEDSQLAKESDTDALKKAEEAKKKAEEAKKKAEEAKKKADEAKKGKQITAAQLTSIINGSSNDYPRGIVINVVGNKPNEQASSIAMIRQYKKMGTWSNITVTHVDYDENNKVRAITVKVVSNSSDSE